MSCSSLMYMIVQLWLQAIVHAVELFAPCALAYTPKVCTDEVSLPTSCASRAACPEVGQIP